MQKISNLDLSPFTSFKCGGAADNAIIFDSQEPIDFEALRGLPQPLNFLGFGSNCLISDSGLRGTTILQRDGAIVRDGDTLVCDAGVWWDDLVMFAINRNLWGLEFTSAIPGSVGAAVVGNIAAYGQAVKDCLVWAETLNTETNELRRYDASELGLEYRISHTLQENRQLLVVRAAFALSPTPTSDLEYDSATQIAIDNRYDLTSLAGRRQTILGARAKAGSLWDYRDAAASRTAGSFFRNPLVSAEKAEAIMNFDESGKSHELLRKMNTVHGGAASRISAAHVLLAAGFTRGQTWGEVRLHPDHVLKIENIGKAGAQDIYDVAEEIVATVKNKLDIVIEPEIRYLGNFNN